MDRSSWIEQSMEFGMFERDAKRCTNRQLQNFILSKQKEKEEDEEDQRQRQQAQEQEQEQEQVLETQQIQTHALVTDHESYGENDNDNNNNNNNNNHYDIDDDGSAYKANHTKKNNQNEEESEPNPSFAQQQQQQVTTPTTLYMTTQTQVMSPGLFLDQLQSRYDKIYEDMLLTSKVKKLLETQPDIVPYFKSVKHIQAQLYPLFVSPTLFDDEEKAIFAQYNNYYSTPKPHNQEELENNPLLLLYKSQQSLVHALNRIYAAREYYVEQETRSQRLEQEHLNLIRHKQYDLQQVIQLQTKKQEYIWDSIMRKTQSHTVIHPLFQQAKMALSRLLPGVTTTTTTTPNTISSANTPVSRAATPVSYRNPSYLSLSR